LPGELQDPANRKPNLEGITRKCQRAMGRNGLYLAAINSDSLKKTNQALNALHFSLSAFPEDADVRDIRVDDRTYRLYIPVIEGNVNAETLDLIMLLQQMELVEFVRVIAEADEHNIQVLQVCRDIHTGEAAPYLEVAIGGATGALLHYCGDEIRRELHELRATLEHRGTAFAVGR